MVENLKQRRRVCGSVSKSAPPLPSLEYRRRPLGTVAGAKTAGIGGFGLYQKKNALSPVGGTRGPYFVLFSDYLLGTHGHVNGLSFAGDQKQHWSVTRGGQGGLNIRDRVDRLAVDL